MLQKKIKKYVLGILSIEGGAKEKRIQRSGWSNAKCSARTPFLMTSR